jgi:predicted metalloprotease with PDZ domain
MTTKIRVMGASAAVLAAAWLTPALSSMSPVNPVAAQARAAAAPQTAPARTGFKTSYRVSFPAPEHHWMQVEATYSGLGTAPLQARMSRSSPGRYAVHEFAKNVFQISGEDGTGKVLKFTRPTVDEWDFAGHNGTVKVTYRIFGDHADGTYFGVDTTHAHLNMPAAFLWAIGHDNDPIEVTFVPPSGLNWKIATQLFPSSSSTFLFTAPNIQYFMDSPTELSNFVMTNFSLPNADGTPANFRVMVHGDGTQADAEELTTMIKRLVQEEEAVYGEFPKYEPGYYTFLLDYAAWGFGDGMEHRNSTSISSPGLSIKTPQGRQQAMSTVAHEFFHNWNVERIRPQGLEPFDFTRENITCCLWLAEGFTQYYGPLLLTRAGFGGGRNGGAPVNNIIPVVSGSGRTVRSAVEMSQYGPFNDAATSIDMTDGNRTFISYYTYGGAVAAGLDLSLRELTNGKTTLDDYMKLLWTRFGKPGGSAPGLVGHPYSLADIRKALADLTNNQQFADTFFDKYIEGREVVDYKHLLALAGLDLRASNPDRGFVGGPVSEGPDGLEVGVQGAGGGRGGRGGAGGAARPVAFNTPLYEAGLDESDVITTIDGQPATEAAWNALTAKKPGDVVALGVKRRDGATTTLKLTVKADPSLQITAMDTLTDAQKAFRDAWLGTKVK